VERRLFGGGLCRGWGGHAEGLTWSTVLPPSSHAECCGEQWGRRTPARDAVGWDSGVRSVWRLRMHVRCGRRMSAGVERSSEARQASGGSGGPQPWVAAGAATQGYGRVPLQGTCRWGSWAAQGDGCSKVSNQRADTEVRAPAMLLVDPVDVRFCLGVQRADKPGGLSPRDGSTLPLRGCLFQPGVATSGRYPGLRGRRKEKS